jgi:hypothetical protein
MELELPDINDHLWDAPFDWHVQAYIRFDLEKFNFTSWKKFREWLFDPECKFERRYRMWRVFWPHCALRVLGLDVGFGIMIRPHQVYNSSPKKETK